MHIALGVTQLRFSIPLGLAYIASALEGAGCRVSLFIIGRQPDGPIQKLLSDPPDLVAYSMMTGEQGRYLAFQRALRRRLPVPSVWGGAHPTYFPELAGEVGVDAVCRGEGEEAIVEFVRRLERTGKVPTDVANFCVRAVDGEMISNPVRPLIADLDALPFPNRRLFLEAQPILHEHGIKHFIATRGCPYKCTYCFNQAFHRLYGERRPSWRARDPRAVCDEIEELRRETRLEMVAFVDDSFTLDREWLARFTAVYRQRIGLPFSCNFRLDNFDRETAELLSAAGCRLAYVGIESGDDQVRRRLLARKMSNDQIRTAFALLDEHGIRTIAENMIGLPGESFAEARETLRLNMELKPTLANCSLFTPYPDLPLTRYAIRNGYFDGTFERLGGNYYHTSVMNFASSRERRRMINLRSFFSLLGRHPRLWPLIAPLLELPPNWLFRILGDWIDGHYLRKCLTYRMSPARFLRILRHFLRSYR